MDRLIKAFHIVAFSLASSSLALGQSARPTERSDMEALGDRLCNSKTTPDPRDIWKLDIFDTQMEAAWVDADQSIRLTDLNEAARAFAAQNKHHGFAFGLCTPSRAWIVSTPAPHSFAHIQNNSLSLDKSFLRSHCRSYDVDFAQTEGGGTHSLLSQKSPEETPQAISLTTLGLGTVSVTCHPTDSERDGPELWALLPTKPQSMNTSLPALNSNQEGLLDWIQGVRKAQNLAPLRTDSKELNDLASLLGANKTIKHPHATLNEAKLNLEKHKIQLLGENRVLGSKPQDMAWLLWNSPQHRRLLLNPEANALAIQREELGTQKLLVLILAKTPKGT